MKRASTRSSLRRAPFRRCGEGRRALPGYRGVDVVRNARDQSERQVHGAAAHRGRGLARDQVRLHRSRDPAPGRAARLSSDAALRELSDDPRRPRGDRQSGAARGARARLAHDGDPEGRSRLGRTARFCGSRAAAGAQAAYTQETSRSAARARSTPWTRRCFEQLFPSLVRAGLGVAHRERAHAAVVLAAFSSTSSTTSATSSMPWLGRERWMRGCRCSRPRRFAARKRSSSAIACHARRRARFFTLVALLVVGVLVWWLTR